MTTTARQTPAVINAAEASASTGSLRDAMVALRTPDVVRRFEWLNSDREDNQ